MADKPNDLPHLAERLNILIARYEARTGRRLPNSRLSAALKEIGVQITPAYLSALRTGVKNSLGGRQLVALADFFGVQANYFTRDHVRDIDVAIDVAIPQQVLAADAPDGPLDVPDLAERLNRLFEVNHSRHDPEESNAYVAAAISAASQERVTAEDLAALRSGERTDASAELLQALADYFGITVEFFTDDAVAAEIINQFRLLVVLRDTGIRKLALRAHDLRADDRDRIADFIERLTAGRDADS